MTQGILLIAFGKQAYAKMAVHMAATLKIHSPDIPIAIAADSRSLAFLKRYTALFDRFDELPQSMVDNGPGFVKLQMTKFAPYDTTLFLDCDGHCCADVTPMLEVDKDFASIVVGKGGRNDEITYAHWATNANAWDHFMLEDGDTFYALQSSAILMRKGEVLDKVTQAVDDFIHFPIAKLKNQWGGTLPDELIWSGAVSRLGIDPDFGMPTVFFGSNHKLSIAEVKERFMINSAYGGGSLVKDMYLDWYDRAVQKACRKFGFNKLGGIKYLSRQKHVFK